ncbi:UV radiation resistance protein and autophagy-related subunit 14-domain-containing protein [Exophiala viscosa]|uniref:Autophagy-related protein 14 n=1 Tax=Exophiala viscosa TaxID=2486360 RepID=A0AAN6DKI1_9EURO|nr:UV radiation resistance protein and autophagy-related subunit 14-domain-containing protein [Exophiala viscosa]KAI1620155.1 UV radiation resistance protein and autophagy-related subunit 14-domain-containing protein [Exophiala viscosa]
MAESAGDPSTATKVRNERPFLYPWNRRLRHWHGVSLRNLHVTAPTPRKNTKTSTDDEAPYNLTSPAKRALEDDVKPLSQSRSFTDLSTANDGQPTPGIFHKAATSYAADGKQSSRPAAGRLRRRSTLHWSSASPLARQSKLEDMVVNRLADTWVSIHCPGVEEPIYISEVIERSMNPSFASFDLDGTGPQATRSDEATIRVWAKSAGAEEYCLLVDFEFNLRSLQFVGRNLENFHHPLPQNCILLHLSDGIYTSFTDLPPDSHPEIEHSVDHKAGSNKPGSTFDSLMQLANLEECIQDAVKVRSQLEDDINKLIADAHLLEVGDEVGAELDDDDPQIQPALTAEQKHLRQLTKRRDELRDSLDERRRLLAECREAEVKTQALVDERTKDCKDVQTQIDQVEKDTNGQIRRICETILAIFPIEPVKGRTLQFTIRGIHLPNSVYNDTNRDEIAAALGFTAQVVYQLALYLSIPLPYPIEPYGSASFVSDPISIGLSQRRYPLHPTTVPYKFEYGVFLLNKDIEFLMNRVGLRVLDIRHTLPNLKYLLYVLTAGTGELPARKAGGVRGLIAGRMSMDMSRRTSEDSVQSLPASLRRHVADTRTNGGLVSSKEKEIDDPFVSVSPGTGLPYQQGLP